MLPSVPIGAGELHVWHADPRSADDASLLRAYEGLLSDDEARRYRGFRVERARREYLVTRALVRTALSHHAPVASTEWRFEATPSGRPEISLALDLRFNVAHCDGLIVCAVTRRLDVGVDAEPHSRGLAILALGPRVFSDAEREGLARLPPSARGDRALSLWTLKESYAKARGIGLSLPLRALSFELGGDCVLLSDGWSADGERFRFELLDVRAHRVALAVGGALAAVHSWSSIPLVGYERQQLTTI
jgi:4'-phosphopantetheinyl transferase